MAFTYQALAVLWSLCEEDEKADATRSKTWLLGIDRISVATHSCLLGPTDVCCSLSKYMVTCF
jgi:hypothetical protein